MDRVLTLADGRIVDALNRHLTPPLVSITTAGGAPVTSKDVYVAGAVTISRTGESYAGSVQIRGRGNSTWLMPKKPYRLKLGAAASLLGMPADRDWVLLANYYDHSQIRTALAYEIGRRADGLAWTPRMRHVEVLLNGTYLGAYLLGEHVKAAPARIPIALPDEADISGVALTGGYELEIDANFGDGDPRFQTAHDNLPVIYDDSVPEQAAYIQAWVNQFETVLYGPDWLNPTNGYRRYIDLPSFLDWYLVQELTANVDSDFHKSCKLYKTRDDVDGGRLHMGPLWDFDLSFGTGWDDGDAPTPWDLGPTGFFVVGRDAQDTTRATWYERMLTDPAFDAALRQRWQQIASL